MLTLLLALSICCKAHSLDSSKSSVISFTAYFAISKESSGHVSHRVTTKELNITIFRVTIRSITICIALFFLDLQTSCRVIDCDLASELRVYKWHKLQWLFNNSTFERVLLHHRVHQSVLFSSNQFLELSTSHAHHSESCFQRAHPWEPTCSGSWTCLTGFWLRTRPPQSPLRPPTHTCQQPSWSPGPGWCSLPS